MSTMLFKIPEELFADFENVSGRNFCPSDNRHIETFAYILGEAARSSNGISAIGLLYPDQDGFSGHVKSRGKTMLPLKLWVHNRLMLVYSTPDS